MDDARPAWDDLAVSNIVPDPGFSAQELTVRCSVCGATMLVDPRGGLVTGQGGGGFVCDRCGDAQAPAEMDLVRQLRGHGHHTVTIDGADFERDPFAWTCPTCDIDLATKPPGWHVVDREHGRPVCAACLHDVDTSLTALADQLNARERKGQA